MARILVADDDADIRELVQFKLTSLGHEVEQVEDGTAALAAMRQRRPDLVLLDLMMPGLTGLEVVREARADEALRDLPIILLTARAHQSDIEHGLSSGVDDYVTKPFSPRELGARVAALLDGRTTGEGG